MEKIVSRRVVGSSNPFGKFFRGLAASVKGIATGILFVIISFVMIYFLAFQKEHSKVIADLPVQTPEEVENVEGMVKIKGVPNYMNVVVARNTDKDVLYYDYLKEEYAIREVEKTRTYDDGGKTIEETYVEYEPKWKELESERKWSEFNLGPIKIVPNEAKLQTNETTFFTETTDLDYDSYLSDEYLVDVPQKYRVTVTGVDAGDELIVVGKNSGNVISTGEEGTFFISNKSDAQLVEDQAGKEKMTFWILAVVTWFLMTSGFTMLLGPITKILDILPGVGGLVNGLLFIIFGIISAIMIFLAYVGMKYWWAILVIVVGAVGFLVYRRVNKEPEKIQVPKK